MPPVIKRQLPTDRPMNGRKAKSVLDEAVPVGELESEFLKFVLYGQNRTGKTTLACQFPKPLLLVDFEPARGGGALSVKKVPGVKVVHVRSVEKALRLAAELLDRGGYKTVVLDTATSLQDVVLMELMGLDDAPVQLNWGTVSRDQYRERSEKTKEVLRKFLDLPCHTVVNAKERDHNPPDREQPEIVRGEGSGSFFASDLGGQTVGWLHDACDYLGRLYWAKEVRTERVKVLGKWKERQVETGGVIQRLRTMYHPNYAAGFRAADPSVVPEFVEAKTPQELYGKVMKVVRGEKLP